uniref:nucleoporin nup124-like isoform X2 n=1 Tax=Ciona intestinalis TaxID=7719 RepID=UPI000EF51709|nr:nucleoporin nup124-like isoform X2 [Ciona intestinalis]|eukprot:XP_026692285.1 nucleoporin nup124-like isoform X2 [Ciona intestinalis]
MSMANVSEGPAEHAKDLPGEFLRLLQELSAEIENESRIVAEEKCLIDKYEAGIKECTNDNKHLEESNLELNSSLKHLMGVAESQHLQLESSQETGELLRQQAKSKEEEYYRVKQKHHHLKNACGRKYEHYQEIYCERMLAYESLPLVPEYKRQVSKVEELEAVLHDTKKDLDAVKREMATLQAEQDTVNLKFPTLADWGVNLAQTMLSIKQLKFKSSKMKTVNELQQELKYLSMKKASILQVPKSKPIMKVPSAEQIPQSTIGMTKLEPFGGSKRSVPVPNFLSFFKNRSSIQRSTPSGSSGSSLRSSSGYSSLPNIKAMLTPNKPKLPAAAPVGRLESEKQKQSVDTSMVPQVVDLTTSEENEQILRKSISLSNLQDQKLKVKEPVIKSHDSRAQSGSLSVWLNTTSANDTTQDKKQDIENAMEVTENISTETEEKSQKQMPKSVSIPNAPTWSHPLPQPSGYNRVSDLPLLRKVQMKMVHEKSSKSLSPGSPQCRSPETKQTSPSKSHYFPGYFDGAVYDLPMKSGESLSPVSSQKTSPRTPEMVHMMTNQHREMMAELEKSPDDFYEMQANVIAPSSASNMAHPNNTRFHVTSPPSPAISSQSPEYKTPEGFSFGVGEVTSPSGDETKSPPFSFNFQAPAQASPTEAMSFNFMSSGETSPPQNLGFNFGNAKPAQNDSGFSFSFDRQENTGSSSTGFTGFSGASTQQSTSSPSPFFTFSDTNNNTDSDTSFSALFGCGK